MGVYIQLVSVHGLVRGEAIEMGRDQDTGGQIRYVVDLARTLGRMEGVEQVDLFTRLIRDKRVSDDYAQPVEELGPNARIVRLPCGGGRYMRKERLWPHLDDFVDAMISFIRKEGRLPAVVHGHYADGGYIANEVASAFAVPFAFTGHSLGRDKQAYLREQGWQDEAINKEFSIEQRIQAEETCLAAADFVVASTRHERDEQYRRYENGNIPRFEVIPPGTDLTRFFPYYEYDFAPEHIDEIYKQARMRMLNQLGRFHFEPERPLILALCRPDKRKNIASLIEAYGTHRELQVVANLAIFAGIRDNITEMPESEQEVLKDILMMMDRYDLYGKMAIPKRHHSEHEVPELYRLAASKRGVFVNTAYVEPFGLTYIEASACGLPFVGTNNGGPVDIVENCASGLLVDVNDVDAIAGAIFTLLKDREAWDTASNNGINRVREHYTWKKHCDHFLSVVNEISETTSKNVPAQMGPCDVAGRRLAELDALLITDIDNTLTGDEAALAELSALLREERDRLGFGVASGRYLAMVEQALQDHDIPDLDVVIASVGTEIYYGPERMFDKGWASHLRYRWKVERIREALDGLEFLTLQEDPDTQREFKVSYDLDPKRLPVEEALARIRQKLSKTGVPHQVIFSHGVFVDILPVRASKGKAVRFLSQKWNIPIERIATAGDSGNDEDMLRGRTAGIVVGNYTEELEPLRRSSARLYFSDARHAAGILDGLRHYGFFPAAAAAEAV